METGIAHPGAYAKAFLAQTRNFWDPFSAMDSEAFYFSSERSFFIAKVDPPATHDSKLPELYEWLYSLCRTDAADSYPFLAALSSLPLFVCIMILALVKATFSRDRLSLAVCLFAVLLTGSVLVGPGVLFRYYLPIYFMAPLLAAIVAVPLRRTPA